MLLVISASIPVSQVGAEPPPDYFVDESKLPFDALPGASAYWGVHTGAGFRAEVPDNWNGGLVIWAHGSRTGLELTVQNHPLRELLIALGYAWAASSYSRNDINVTTGVQDTHALLGHLTRLIGRPSLVYLTGGSLGGHVTAVSIEQYPQSYDAALPICGVLADYEHYDAGLDLIAAAQQLGTGSSQFPVDPTTWIYITVPQIKANLESVSGGWPILLNGAGQNFKSLAQLRSGGVRPNFDEAWYFWNSLPGLVTGLPGNFLFDFALTDGVLPRSPGIGLDNSDVVYQFDTDPALSPEEQDFNDSVFRLSADPQGRRGGLAQVPQVSGDITVPVLTLHNLGDLLVPILNEVEYARRVNAKGKSDLLVQRAIRGVNHCDFTPNEFATAFFDLALWVEAGIKPAGDNFLDEAAVADPSFGCAFTDGDHLLGTPCP